MIVYINNKPTDLPRDVMTVEQLLQFLNIKRGGTAVAINNKLILNKNWGNTGLKSNDSITLISAAFGG